jgi:hypothetical protein
MGDQEIPVFITASWDEVVFCKLACVLSENNDRCQSSKKEIRFACKQLHCKQISTHTGIDNMQMSLCFFHMFMWCDGYT